MSDAYARDRFMEAAGRLHRLEPELRERPGAVDAKKVDAALIDLNAAIQGLDGEDLGRALVLKAYATQWRYLVELGQKKSIFEVLKEGKPGADPRLVEALADAKKGQALLQTPGDKQWAASTVTLEGYMR
jgi:hypothetical protein